MISTVRAGHARGVSGAFLGAWLAGEVCMSIYVGTEDPLLLANYAGNALIVAGVVAVKIRGQA